MPRSRNWTDRKRASARSCAKGSFRTKTVKSGVNLTVCCPRGKWNGRSCKVGMKAVTLRERKGFGAAGDPTDTNLWVLERQMGGKDTAPNQIRPTSVPHMRRCVKAGLVTVDGAQLHLTEKGKAVLALRAGGRKSANDNFGRHRWR